MRLGLYGGTFDPPHLAHLVAAERARDHLRLDQVWFVPCGTPALKGPPVASAAHRLEMTRLAVEERPEFVVSDIELCRGTVSYTIDTLRELCAAQAGEWWLLLGADALADFPRWRDPEQIAAMARLAAVDRFGIELETVLARLPSALAERVDIVPMPRLQIASHELRADLAAGRSVRYLVPESVLAYALKHHLYGSA